MIYSFCYGIKCCIVFTLRTRNIKGGVKCSDPSFGKFLVLRTVYKDCVIGIDSREMLVDSIIL